MAAFSMKPLKLPTSPPNHSGDTPLLGNHQNG